jgi:hypothetical protein
MEAIKYRDLVVLFILLDEAELRAKKLAEQFPELKALSQAISKAADLCDLAITVEDIVGLGLAPH